MTNIVLDENVSLDLAGSLRGRGHQVYSIVESSQRGIPDFRVWEEVKKRQAILITRDYHFTNPCRFPSHEVFSILYIRQGNLKSVEEINLVLKFLASHREDEFKGKLVTLSQSIATVR